MKEVHICPFLGRTVVFTDGECEIENCSEECPFGTSTDSLDAVGKEKES